mmetsp:Transcript_75363/g.245108  ORF Transcript_75363/g.245108 Transcript_75363/m.245108 type:complete len:211 (+) Transcript_75363:1673-2305(+)
MHFCEQQPSLALSWASRAALAKHTTTSASSVDMLRFTHETSQREGFAHLPCSVLTHTGSNKGTNFAKSIAVTSTEKAPSRPLPIEIPSASAPTRPSMSCAALLEASSLLNGVGNASERTDDGTWGEKAGNSCEGSTKHVKKTSSALATASSASVGQCTTPTRSAIARTSKIQRHSRSLAMAARPSFATGFGKHWSQLLSVLPSRKAGWPG